MPELPVTGLEYSPYGFEGLQARREPPRALARSANLEMAIGELSAYLAHAMGDVTMGRSCLIAGARGAGKTTMIDRAFEEARDSSQRRRLIRVRLHGPSLLNPPKPVPTKDNPNPAEIPVQEHVLKRWSLICTKRLLKRLRTHLTGMQAAFGRTASSSERNCASLWMEPRLRLRSVSSGTG